MSLPIPYPVYGTISISGSPVNGATVYAQDITAGSIILQTTTGVDGRYIIDLMSIAADGDTIRVWASSTGYYNESSFTLSTSGAAKRVDLSLSSLIKDLTVDSWLRATRVKTYTLQGWLTEIETKDYTLDSWLYASNVKDIALDAGLLSRDSDDYTLDSRLLSRRTKDLILGSHLRTYRVKDHVLDGLLRSIHGKDYGVDSYLLSRSIRDYALDAHALARSLLSYTLAGDLGVDETLLDILLNAHLQSRTGLSFTLDALSYSHGLLTSTLDAGLYARDTKDYSLDAGLLSTLLLSMVLNAELGVESTGQNYNLNACIYLRQTGDIDLDARLKTRAAKDYMLASWLRKLMTSSLTLDACTQSHPIKNIVIDGYVGTSETLTQGFTLDAILMLIGRRYQTPVTDSRDHQMAIAPTTSIQGYV